MALSMCIGMCFLAIATSNAAYQFAERLNVQISETALVLAQAAEPSDHLFDAVAEGERSGAVPASEKFHETWERLTSTFQTDGWPDAAVYEAPFSYLAAAVTLSRPPQDLRHAWTFANENAVAVERASGSGQTMPRTLMLQLQSLQKATADWKHNLSFYSSAITLIACLGLIGAIFYTRFWIVAPLLNELDVANAALSGRNEKLEQMVEERTKDLSQALKDATSAHEARARFMASVNHEMRTPLNGVLGVAALLDKTQLSKQQSRLVDTIKISGKTLVRLIDDVLDFVSLSTGRMNLDVRAVELPELLRDAMDLLRPMAEEKGLSVFVEIPPSEGDMVMADGERVAQIANNLFGNAVKFTEAGHVTLRFNQQFKGAMACVTIEVIDTGPGISEEKTQRLFVPFERRALGAPTKGTGLGLAITKSLVDEMGGELSMESEVGTGTHVKVHIPFAVVGRAGATQEAA